MIGLLTALVSCYPNDEGDTQVGRRRYTADDIDPLLEEIKGLRRDIAELRAERDTIRDDLDAWRRIEDLQREIEKLTIERDRKKEEFDRERREVTHMVGLEKKRQTVELEQAKREATLAVREENLAADKERFDKHVEFIETRFGEEVTYLRGIMGEILERLPTVTVDKQVTARSARG